jgi:hypothetical protein
MVPEVNPKPIPVFNDFVSCFNMGNSAMEAPHQIE